VAAGVPGDVVDGVAVGPPRDGRREGLRRRLEGGGLEGSGRVRGEGLLGSSRLSGEKH